MLRDGIEVLRADYAVLNRDDGKGYYLPEETDSGRADTKRWHERQERREYKRFAHRRRERLNLSEWAEESLKAYMDSSACSEMEDKQDGEDAERKGKRGERELAGILQDYGYNCRRGQQYCGASGDADMIGLPECTYRSKTSGRPETPEALQQSSRTPGRARFGGNAPA